MKGEGGAGGGGGGWGSVTRSSDREIAFFFFAGETKSGGGNFLIAINRGILLISSGQGLAFLLSTFKFGSQLASLDGFQVFL